jgi:hypothetical protein
MNYNVGSSGTPYCYMRFKPSFITLSSLVRRFLNLLVLWATFSKTHMVTLVCLHTRNKPIVSYDLILGRTSEIVLYDPNNFSNCVVRQNKICFRVSIFKGHV